MTLPPRQPPTFLELVVDAVRSGLANSDAWKRFAGHAIAEGITAKQHEGRTVPEMLQNIRDAICIALGLPGVGSIVAERVSRALIIVTDTGMLVADPGCGFDLSQEAVRDSVLYLHRTTKAAGEYRELGLVGIWGIGLKSILKRCQAFQIWSTPDDELIGADFKRSRSLEILDRELAEVTDPAVLARVEAEIHHLPLFLLPHDACESDPDAQLALALLGRTGLPPALRGLNLPTFRTVIRLQFEDEVWTDRVGRRETPTDPDDLWQTVCELDPNSLLLLGAIQTLDAVRMSGDAVRETAQWTVEPLGEVDHLDLERPVRHRQIRVRTSGSAGETRVEWDAFVGDAAEHVIGYDADSLGPAEICIAIPRVEPEAGPQDLPLFMNYAIQPPEDGRGAGLPFLVHGPFLVKPDRTGLDGSERTWNAAVLKALAGLVPPAASHLARDEERAVDLPWCLLPDPADHGDLVSTFRADIFAALEGGRFVQRGDGELHPEVAPLLIGDGKALGWLASLADLTGESIVLPSPDSIRRLRRWVDRWHGTSPLKRAIPDPAGADSLVDLLVAWAAPHQIAFPTTAEQAAAVAELAHHFESDAFVSRAGRKGAPILPCEDPADPSKALLVRANVQDTGKRSEMPRVVLYQPDPNKEVESVQPPPEVAVYRLRRDAGMWFQAHGMALGLRQDDGAATRVEELLECLPDLTETDYTGGYLVGLLHRASGRAGWLRWEPNGWIPPNTLWSTYKEADPKRRDANHWKLRAGALEWPVPAAAGPRAPAHSTWFGAEWAAIADLAWIQPAIEPEETRLAMRRHRDALTANATFQATTEAPKLAPPNDPSWLPWLEGAQRDLGLSRGRALAALFRTLCFLGVRSTPALEVRWTWPLTLRRPPNVGSHPVAILGKNARWDTPTTEILSHRYRALLREPRYDPWHCGGHNGSCGGRLGVGEKGARLTRWVWTQPSEAPEWAPACLAALRAGWLAPGLATSWTCNDSRGRVRHVDGQDVPTLLRQQLEQISVPCTIGKVTVDAPLGIAWSADTASTGLARFLPRLIAPIDARAAKNNQRGLNLPSAVDELDGARAMRTLAWLRDRPTAPELGLLRRLVRRIFTPAATLHREKYPYAIDVLWDLLSRIDALPATRAGEIIWLNLLSKSGGLALEGQAAVLGPNPTRWDRDVFGPRTKLVDTQIPVHGHLAGFNALIRQLGVEVIRNTPPPKITWKEADRSRLEAIAARLKERLPLLLILARLRGVGDAEIETLADLPEHITACRNLEERYGDKRHPIPSVWHEGALLVDVEQAEPGDISWGIVGCIGHDDDQFDFEKLLGATEGHRLAAVCRKLAIPTTSGTSNTARVRRLDWLQQNLPTLHNPWSKRARILQGRLDVEAVLDLIARSGVSDNDGLRALLASSPFRFAPTQTNRERLWIQTTRRIAACVAIEADPADPVHAVRAAIDLADERLADPFVTLEEATCVSSGPIVQPWLEAESPEGLERLLDAGDYEELVADLLDADTPLERARRAATRARNRADRRHRARVDRWAQVGSASPTCVAGGALSAVPKGKGGARNGVTLKAADRGAVGEIVALRDIVIRLLECHTTDPTTAVNRLHAALELAATWRRIDPPEHAEALALLESADDDAGRDALAAALDIHDIAGPGYDVIDPLGPLDDSSDAPARIEIKTTSAAVSADDTIRFRMTVNEISRARENDPPYIVRVYHDPDDGSLPVLTATIDDPASRLSVLSGAGAMEMLAIIRGGSIVISAKLQKV